jgi:hypothetical protein
VAGWWLVGGRLVVPGRRGGGWVVAGWRFDGGWVAGWWLAGGRVEPYLPSYSGEFERREGRSNDNFLTDFS